jgi:hypothetical protein
LILDVDALLGSVSENRRDSRLVGVSL